MNPTLKRTLTGLTVGLGVASAVLFAPPPIIAPAVAVLALLASVESLLLIREKTPRFTAYSFTLFVLSVLLIFGGMSALPVIAASYGDETCGVFKLGNLMLLYVIAVVKFSDVGGFALGTLSAKLMKGGNHKLCPSISPNKSYEGFFGSLLFSCAISLLFAGITNFSPLKSVLIGIAAAFLGTAGDLVESKFKRWAGVKDSSAMKITNGMGGFLDMFDSLLIAPGVMLLFL